MKRAFCISTWLSLWFTASAAPLLKVPDGFVVETVAGPPAIQYPMFACLDERGRLFVAESSGLDLYQELQQLTRKCRISVLEDLDRDGRYESARVFADQLVFPMGLAWREGKLYVADPPDLVTWEDTDHDGRADLRTVILTGFGHTDNGSLHGLIFGPDGWLYMTLGQPDGYRLKRADGSFLSGKSGALLRCRPDGSDVEVVSRGFENLVEVVFLPSGEIIGTDNWFTLPSSGVRDALVHLLEGGLYPLQLRDVGTPFLVSGDPLPALALYPAVALSGLMQYQGSNFPALMHGDLFSAQFNSRKVVRHKLTRSGSTFTTTDFDFVSTDDPDFHPSDVLETEHGDLLIVDTGAWYVQHCPTGRIRSSPARGGIYRVRFPGTHTTTELSQPKVKATAGTEQELRERLGNSDAVEVAGAARALARLSTKSAEPLLLPLLRHARAEVRLAAAEALAHCGTARAIEPLLEALSSNEPDRFQEHAIIHALHRLASGADLRRALEHTHPRVQKAALLLLAQTPHSSLTPPDVLTRLHGEDRSLRQTALRILRRHPSWVSNPAALVETIVLKGSTEPGAEDNWREVILTFEHDAGVQNFVGSILTNVFLTVEDRSRMLEVIAQSNLPELPSTWVSHLVHILNEGPPPLRLQVARLTRSRPVPELLHALGELLGQEDLAPELRLEAIRTSRLPDVSPKEFQFLSELLKPSHPPDQRLAAAELIGRARWPDGASTSIPLINLVGKDRLISPSTLLPLLLQARGNHLAAVWPYLQEAIRAGWEPSPEEWRSIQDNPNTPDELSRMEAESVARAESRREQLARYAEDLSGGDAERGRQQFANLCSSCHRVQAEGGLLGPDLTKVGAIRSGRDLIESIVLPSATLAQGYEAYVVTLKNGDELTGIRMRQADEGFVLRDASGVETRLRPNQIDSTEQLTLSLMPEGLLTPLTRQQVRDLLAYLQGLK